MPRRHRKVVGKHFDPDEEEDDEDEYEWEEEDDWDDYDYNKKQSNNGSKEHTTSRTIPEVRSK